MRRGRRPRKPPVGPPVHDVLQWAPVRAGGTIGANFAEDSCMRLPLAASTLAIALALAACSPQPEGAATPAAGAFTAIGIALATLLLTPFLAVLPKATLAATIVIAVLTLVDFSLIKRAWDYSKADFAAVAITLAGTLLLGVETVSLQPQRKIWQMEANGNEDCSEQQGNPQLETARLYEWFCGTVGVDHAAPARKPGECRPLNRLACCQTM